MQELVNKTKKNVQAMNIPIPIVDAGDVKTAKGGKAGVRYAKYSDAIKGHVQWLKDQINESQDGKIRVRIKDISKAMGPDFVKKSPTSIYWGLKYSLFKMRLVVYTGKTIAGDEVLYIQHATDKDQLPPSLQKEFIKELDNRVKDTPKPEAPKTVQLEADPIKVSGVWVMPGTPLYEKHITTKTEEGALVQA